MPSCRYDSDDYSQLHIDQKTGDDWRKVYSTPEKHPCYDPSKVPNQHSSLREGCCAVDQPCNWTCALQPEARCAISSLVSGLATAA